jgi:hypothetical protein
MPTPFLLPVAILSGFGRRVAGGAVQQWTGINLGDMPVRLFFGITLAVVALLAGMVWPRALMLIPAGWIGTTIPNFGGIALGRSGNPWWRDALGLTLHGIVGAMVLALVAAAPWPLPTPFSIAAFVDGYSLVSAICVLIAGLLIVPAYEVGWSVAGKSGRASFPLGFRGGTEIGEMLWGTVIGLALMLSALLR